MSSKQGKHNSTTILERLSQALGPLKRCDFRVDQDHDGTLRQAVERVQQAVQSGEGRWCGIAYTTGGAVSLSGVTPSQVLLSTTKDDQGIHAEVDPGGVYELRLWQVGPTDVLAREVRWLNGSGLVEVTVDRDAASVDEGAAVEQDTSSYWYRHGAYLQHGEGARMPTVEVFFVEPTYGNTVYVDELMAGAWG